MAKALATLARRIRARAGELIAAQTESGSLVQLHKAFKEALIRDLTPEGFADSYAQTIACGLLSAAMGRSSGPLAQECVADAVYATSPFLKELLGAFIEAGGRRGPGRGAALDLGELGIGEVVDLLRDADMQAVLADFDRRNPDEDPVIHFYELFLKEYDPEQRVKRGVFYTPRPVVAFIVRSVHELLRTEFGLGDGLASTATWGEVVAARPGTRLPQGAKESDPFVRILDPATGTGTFLVECVDLIHETMVRKWLALGLAARRDGPEIRALWNDYVPRHLLPRLTGFELMMAPYAVAHVKLGLKLAETGYRFGSDAKAQIYLTDALEPAQDLDMQLAFTSQALAHEAKAANEAKETRFTAVIGNPPYSGLSKNMGAWITGLLRGQGGRGAACASYFHVDGEPLGERKVWLQDDYVKFLRLGQAYVERAGIGILAMITNHGYLDNPTFRGMRHALRGTFNLLRITDLHGNSRKKERPPAGVSDENVFDIEQGVAILVAAAGAARDAIEHRDLWGGRKEKSARLAGGPARYRALAPSSPLHLFTAAFGEEAEYSGFPAVTDIFRTSVSGIVTARDDLVVHFDLEGAKDALRQLADPRVSDVDIGNSFAVSDNYAWTLSEARARLRSRGAGAAAIRDILYRPFDVRKMVYEPELIFRMRSSVMRHMTEGPPNLALAVSRSVEIGRGWEHAWCSAMAIQHHSVSLKEVNYLLPLWLHPEGTETRSLPNIAPAVADRVAALTGLAWDDCAEEPEQGAPGGVTPETAAPAGTAPKRRGRGEPGTSFGPRDLFDYVYAVLHSPAYRRRYADYLKSDFARIPLPAGRELFEALRRLGCELVALHLVDLRALPILDDPKSVRLAGSGEPRVAKPPEYDAALGRVAINADRWFETVPQAAWDFHVGGYRPAQKWLKDRAAKGGRKPYPGRVLTDEDILHYRRLVAALARTAELMPLVDEEIARLGGWPGAFREMRG
jgi:predicted helicase